MISFDIALSLVAFGLVAVGMYATLTLTDPYWKRVRQRVGQIAVANAGAGTATAKSRVPESAKNSRLLNELQRLNPYHLSARSQVQQRLAKAGIYDPAQVSRYYLAKLQLTIVPAAVAIFAGVAGYLPLHMTFLGGCILAGFGSLVPGLWLDRAIAHHHLRLQQSLPDFLDLMTVCLEGGLSLQESIRRVGDELRLAHPALASELGVVQRDIELGATVEQALKRFATRSDYEGVRTLSTFIREAQRFGTNITEALRSHADMLRTHREQVAEENAQKAAVKILMPTLLLIFPATFVVMVGPAVIQIQEAFGAK